MRLQTISYLECTFFFPVFSAKYYGKWKIISYIWREFINYIMYCGIFSIGTFSFCILILSLLCVYCAHFSSLIRVLRIFPCSYYHYRCRHCHLDSFRFVHIFFLSFFLLLTRSLYGIPIGWKIFFRLRCVRERNSKRSNNKVAANIKQLRLICIWFYYYCFTVLKTTFFSFCFRPFRWWWWRWLRAYVVIAYQTITQLRSGILGKWKKAFWESEMASFSGLMLEFDEKKLLKVIAWGVWICHRCRNSSIVGQS